MTGKQGIDEQTYWLDKTDPGYTGLVGKEGDPTKHPSFEQLATTQDKARPHLYTGQTAQEYNPNLVSPEQAARFRQIQQAALDKGASPEVAAQAAQIVLTGEPADIASLRFGLYS